MGAFAPAVDGFKSKMATLGYVEGKDIFYDVQSTEVDIDAYKSISQKFVDDKVDLILSFPTEAAMEAKAATQGTNIPVVFIFALTDVEGSNLIKSTREPGGNITGVRYPNSEIASKRFEILLQLDPKAKRVFVPYLKDYPSVPRQLEVIRPQAADKGIELIEFATADPEELQTELESFVTADGIGIDAILMLAEPLVNNPKFYSLLGKFSYDHQIPIGGGPMNVEGKYGSIFGLRPDPRAAGEQAALLVDRIFKGTPAGTIPVVTPENSLQINIKAAQQLGVTAPESLLRQANEILH
jgi:putative ABC transport system substrate-binding protein